MQQRAVTNPSDINPFGVLARQQRQPGNLQNAVCQQPSAFQVSAIGSLARRNEIVARVSNIDVNITASDQRIATIDKRDDVPPDPGIGQANPQTGDHATQRSFPRPRQPFEPNAISEFIAMNGASFPRQPGKQPPPLPASQQAIVHQSTIDLRTNAPSERDPQHHRPLWTIPNQRRSPTN